MWATNAAEKEGGTVLMDVGIVEGGGCEEDEGEECHEYEWVDAVYPTTRCYFCQGYGHMARECPAKSKGKGGAKGWRKGSDEESNQRRRKRRTQRRKRQGRGKRVRKGPRSGEGNRKRIWLPGAVLDMREDRSQVGGVQLLRGWRRGAASGCGRGDHGGGALDRG